jgi:hypothetical protein
MNISVLMAAHGQRSAAPQDEQTSRLTSRAMSYPSIIAPGRRAASVALTAIAILLSAVQMAGAECLETSAATDETGLQSCDLDAPAFVLDDGLASEALVRARADATDGTPWIAQGGKEIPMTLNPTDAGVSVRTSLGAWRDYNARAATKNVDTSMSLSYPALTLPKAPVAPRSPFDIWSNVDLRGYEGSRDESLRAGFGADYKLTHTTSVGVSIERGDARSATSAGVEQDAKASAYVTLQATPLLSLDARTEWQAGNAEFAASSGAAEKSAFILAPKVNHSFALDGGTTLAPFVTYKREFDLGTLGREAGVPSIAGAQSAGAGVTYTKPEAYSLSVTTDVEGLGATEPQSVNSKFQLSVPIR